MSQGLTNALYAKRFRFCVLEAVWCCAAIFAFTTLAYTDSDLDIFHLGTTQFVALVFVGNVYVLLYTSYWTHIHTFSIALSYVIFDESFLSLSVCPFTTSGRVGDAVLLRVYSFAYVHFSRRILGFFPFAVVYNLFVATYPFIPSLYYTIQVCLYSTSPITRKPQTVNVGVFRHPAVLAFRCAGKCCGPGSTRHYHVRFFH